MSIDPNTLSMLDQYLYYKDKYIREYGDRTVIFYNSGTFYELCERSDDTDLDSSISRVCDIMGIRLTTRGNNHEEPYHFAGFPCEHIERYSARLLECGYRIVVVDQVTDTTNLRKKKRETREVTRIITPGTSLDTPNWSSNYIISIFIEQFTKALEMSVCICDLSTGKVELYRFTSNIIEELVRILARTEPKEAIVSSKRVNAISKEELDSYLAGINTLWFWNNAHPDYFKTSYRDAMAPDIDGDIVIPYLALLNYVRKHCPLLVEKLKRPCIGTNDQHLVLFNASAKELDLYHGPRRESLFTLIDRTHTAMGRRLFQERLLNPIRDPEELERRYEAIARAVPCDEHLKGVPDLQRLNRKLELMRLHPSELARYYLAMKGSVSRLVEGMGSSEATQTPLGSSFITHCEAKYDLEALGGYSLNDISGNVFAPGVCLELEEMEAEQGEVQRMVDRECERVTEMIKEADEKGEAKLMRTEKGEYYLNVSKARFKKIEGKLEGFKVQKLTSYCKLISGALDKATNRMARLEKGFREVAGRVYLESLRELCDLFLPELERICAKVAQIDFVNAGAKMASEFGYCRPRLISSTSRPCIRAVSLRHPIVERIRRSVEYVGNDIALGDQLERRCADDGAPGGITLFGLNGGGKSTFSKSVGIAVVMAQAGLYVPASSFEYSPYGRLFTRLNGNDDIMRGESSFVLEMNELKSIFTLAGPDSLVIGDEICRGTEVNSALAIVMSAIKRFVEREVQFIFATHLHRLVELSDFRALPEGSVRVAHLHVEIGEDELIYHRRLRDGAGPGIYGIEVMRHYIKDDDFVATAFRVRDEVMGSQEVQVGSRYNPDVIIDACTVCGKRESLDVHHIKFQCSFGGVTQISGVSKDQLSNLVVLCKGHHQDVHGGRLEISGWLDTPQGRRLDYRQVAQEELDQATIIAVATSGISKREALRQLEQEHGIKLTTYKLNKVLKGQHS